MKSYHRKYLDTRLKLYNLRASAFYSDVDDCFKTIVNCSKCAASYAETLDNAEALAVTGQPMLCIKCDEVAATTRSPRITIAGIMATQ